MSLTTLNASAFFDVQLKLSIVVQVQEEHELPSDLSSDEDFVNSINPLLDQPEDHLC